MSLLAVLAIDGGNSKTDLALVAADGTLLAAVRGSRLRSAQVLANPRHPYTQLLLSAVPDPRAPLSVAAETDRGEPPKVMEPAPGCRFRWRCPLAIEACSAVTPALAELRPGHEVACHVAQTGAEVRAFAS